MAAQTLQQHIYSIECPNGTSHPANYKLQIKTSSIPNIGLGVFALEHIPERKKICKWQGGESITYKELKERYTNANGVIDWRGVYRRRPWQKQIVNKKWEQRCINNWVNDSMHGVCAPNGTSAALYREANVKHDREWLVSKRAIEAGEELFLNCGRGYSAPDWITRHRFLALIKNTMACYVSPSGLVLQSANSVFGAANSNLVIYDTASVTANMNGAVANTALTISFVRIGPIVHAIWGSTTGAGNSSATTINWTGVPAGFQPGSDVHVPVTVAQNGTQIGGQATVSAGNMKFWYNATNVVANVVEFSNWPSLGAGATIGPFSGSVTYSAAV